ncbi:MAG: transglycosylase domain-containing protein, partial [Candidatus Sericytochromatia bacterium]
PQHLKREKTLKRKAWEVQLAREIEDAFSKDEILEMYLNQIYLGGGMHGVEAAAQIAVDVITNAENVPKERLEKFSETVLPKVVEAKMQRLLETHDGDPVKASEAMQDSALGQGLANIQGTGDHIQTIRDFGQDLKDLNESIKNRNAAAVADVVDEAAANPSKLSTSLAGLGVVMGAMAFKDADGFQDRAAAVLQAGEGGAEVAAAAAQTIGKLAATSKVVGALEGAGAVLGIVAGTVSGIQNLKDGNYVAAAADGATVALGVIAMTSSLPGVNLAAGVIAGGMVAYDHYQAQGKVNESMNEIEGILEDMGVEKGKTNFMLTSKPGTYQQAMDHMGLSSEQVDQLVKDGSPWNDHLEKLTSPEFKEHILPKLAPGGKPEA